MQRNIGTIKTQIGTTRYLQFGQKMAKSLLFMTLWLVGIGSSCCLAQAANTDAKPDKATLIRTLRQVFELLSNNDLQAASEHFVLPPDFKLDELKGLIEKKELSAVGIDRLESSATFGKFRDTYGAMRSNQLAERAGVKVEQCYAFKLTTPEAIAEVVAYWNGSRYQFIRLDDVGKLSGDVKPSAVSVEDEKQAIAKSLPQLEAAVNANPKDIPARAKYAMALYEIGNLPAAWSQLRTAQTIDPKFAGINKGIAELLRVFENSGLFNVGVPSESIEALLGKPDQVVDLGRGERWVYSFFGIDFQSDRIHEVIDLRGATEALFQPTEYIRVDLDGRSWSCSVRSKSAGRSTALYYLPGESIVQWTEQIEINRILDAAQTGTLTEIKDKLVAQLKLYHANLQEKVIEEDEQSMIVALVFPEQPGFEKRHQLLRILKGTKDVHRISYTVKTDNPSDKTQRKWLAIFQNAKLTPVSATKE